MKVKPTHACGGVAVYVCSGGGGCRRCRCKEEGMKMKIAYQWVLVVVVTFDADGWWRSGSLVSVNRQVD